MYYVLACYFGFWLQLRESLNCSNSQLQANKGAKKQESKIANYEQYTNQGILETRYYCFLDFDENQNLKSNKN